MAPKQKPVKQFRRKGIRAAIWANQTQDHEVWYTVTLSRHYKDGDQWKDASSFRWQDLQLARKVLDRADDWIESQFDSDPTDENSDDNA